MKLGLYPVLLTVLVTLLLLLARTAEASPRRGPSFDGAHEDALADGDIDEEDIATSPLSSLSSATSGRPIVGRPSGSAWVSLLGFGRQAPLQGRHEIGAFIVVGLPLDRFARANTRMTAAPIAALSPALDLVPASTHGPATLQRASSTEQPFELALTPRFARSCVTAAWRAAGLGADDARLEHRDARTRIGAKVLDALFHWQRAALDLRSLPPAQQGTRDEADVRLRLMEAAAALDVLTNGWFAAQNTRGSQITPEYATPLPLGRSAPGDL